MIDIKTLNNYLEIIEEPENLKSNYFKSIYKTCHLAEFAMVELWESGAIGDNERANIEERISKAKNDIIEKHKIAVKSFLVCGDIQLRQILEMLIDSIYKEVF